MHQPWVISERVIVTASGDNRAGVVTGFDHAENDALIVMVRLDGDTESTPHMPSVLVRERAPILVNEQTEGR